MPLTIRSRDVYKKEERSKMAHCPYCGRVVRREHRFCPWCRHTLDDMVVPPLRSREVSGNWEQCPKCHSTRLIRCERCKGFGEVLGVWHKEPCPVCHKTGKLKCDYPGCRNGRVWVSA